MMDAEWGALASLSEANRVRLTIELSEAQLRECMRGEFARVLRAVRRRAILECLLVVVCCIQEIAFLAHGSIPAFLHSLPIGAALYAYSRWVETRQCAQVVRLAMASGPSPRPSGGRPAARD